MVDPKPEVTNNKNHDTKITNNNTLIISTKPSERESDHNVRPTLIKSVIFSENNNTCEYTKVTQMSLSPNLEVSDIKNKEVAISSHQRLQSPHNNQRIALNGAATHARIDSRGDKQYDKIKGDNVDTVLKGDTTDVCTELPVTDIECNDSLSGVNYLPDICRDTGGGTDTKGVLFTIEGGVDHHICRPLELDIDDHHALRASDSKTKNLAKRKECPYSMNTKTESNTHRLDIPQETKNSNSKQMELAELETSFQTRDSVIKFTHGKNSSHATRLHDHFRFPSSSINLNCSATLVSNPLHRGSLASAQASNTQHYFTKTLSSNRAIDRHSCCANQCGVAYIPNARHVKKCDINQSVRMSGNATHLCTINEVSELKIDKRSPQTRRCVYQKAENSTLNLPVKQNIVNERYNRILNSVSIDVGGEKKVNPLLDDIELSESGVHLSQRTHFFLTCLNFLVKRLGFIRSKKVDQKTMTSYSPHRHGNLANPKNVSHGTKGTISEQTAVLVNRSSIQMDSLQNANAARNTQCARNVIYAGNKNVKQEKTDENVQDLKGKDSVETGGDKSYTLQDVNTSVDNERTHADRVVICVQPAPRENIVQNIDRQQSALEIPDSVSHDSESTCVNTVELGKSKLNVPGITNHDVTSGKPSTSSDDGSHAQPSLQKAVTRKPMGKMERRRREEFQLAGSLVVVIVLFVICWFPYCISMFISVFTPERSSRGLDMTSLFLGYFNSCVNPIVYGLMNKKFKAAYIRLFTSCLRLLCKKNRFDLRPNNSTHPHRPVPTIALSTSA